VDLPVNKCLDPTTVQQIHADQIWGSLDTLLSLSTQILRIISQLAFVAHLSRDTGGSVLALLSICQPIVSNLFDRELWNKGRLCSMKHLPCHSKPYVRSVCIGYVNNPTYQRLSALEKLAWPTYRQDVISGGLQSWVVKGEWV